MFDNPNPCTQDCPRRSATCHTDCWDYFQYDLFNIINRDLAQQEKQTKRDCYECTRFYRDKRKKRPYMDWRDNQ